MPKKKPHKHTGQAAVLQDINNIFNTLATKVISCGCSPSHKSSSPSPNNPAPHQKHTWSLSWSLSPPRDSVHGRSSMSSHTKHPSKCAWLSSWSSPSPKESAPQRPTDESGTEQPSKCTCGSLPVASPKKLPKCEWRDGKVPMGRPGARDYEHEVSNITLKLMCEYATLMVSNNSVPLPEQQVAWATGSWECTCERNGVEYELSDRIIGLVSLVSIKPFTRSRADLLLCPSRFGPGQATLVHQSRTPPAKGWSRHIRFARPATRQQTGPKESTHCLCSVERWCIHL